MATGLESNQTLRNEYDVLLRYFDLTKARGVHYHLRIPFPQSILVVTLHLIVTNYHTKSACFLTFSSESMLAFMIGSWRVARLGLPR